MAETPNPTYSTRVLTRVLESQKRPNRFLTQRYFPGIVLSEAEEISFDVELHDEKLAPFCAPVVRGEILLEDGFQTETIKPAYIKIVTPLTPLKSIKRVAGESFGSGTLTRNERQGLRVARTIARHQDRIYRRLEWMAATILATGGVTIEGPRYPKRHLNFGRAAALGIQLIGGDRWNQAGADPVRDLENWAQATFDESGAVIQEITMDNKAWSAFRSNEKVLKLLDIRRAEGAGPLNIGPGSPVADGAVYKGSLNQFQIFVYNAGYIDGAGNRVPYLPEGTVIGVAAEFQGVRYYGAIEDEEAGIKPYECFMKSWLEHDPSTRLLLSQSAPIMAPGRKNASFSARVF